MTEITDRPPFRDRIPEKNEVARARELLAEHAALDGTDLNAYVISAARLSINVERLLEVVANLQAVADYYEQRDARFDQAAATIRGGAR